MEKRPEMEGLSALFRVAMRLGKRRALPDTPEGRLKNWVETAKAHIMAKVEHPFRVMKQPWALRRHGCAMAKNRCKVKMMAAMTNLYLARRQRIATG
jgi:IS5 family transposase